MKTKLYTIKILTILALILNSISSNAQCSFDPTITGNVLLCDENDAVTLSTQTYDTYQWYRREWYWNPSVPNPNPWVAVPGETDQTFTTNGFSDFLFEFKVEATLSGCTEDSPLVLIDGYAYGLPYMIVNFEPGTYQEVINDDGIFVRWDVCNGSSVVLEQGYPLVYGYHTWYNCMPSVIPPDPTDACIIQDINGDNYTVTESGTYGFYACTEYCPNVCEYLGSNSFAPLNFGEFPFCSLGTNNPQYNSLELTIYPNPTVKFINIGKIQNYTIGNLSIVDNNGKLIKQINNFILETPIDVNDLATGTYFLQLSANDKIYRNKFIKK